MIHITDTVAFEEREIEERFVRAAGPRGTNPDRDATAVELRFDIQKSSLPRDVKDRLIALGGRHVTGAGVLVVVARADRSQLHNRTTAHERLFSLLERAARSPVKRRPTSVPPVEHLSRLIGNRRQGAVKRARRKHRDDDASR